MSYCLCGDIYCHSCGPAQGNIQCEMCGSWSQDGGCNDVAACSKAQRELDDRLAADIEESNKLAPEIEQYLKNVITS